MVFFSQILLATGQAGDRFTQCYGQIVACVGGQSEIGNGISKFVIALGGADEIAGHVAFGAALGFATCLNSSGFALGIAEFGFQLLDFLF